MTAPFYVYAHRQADTGEVFYVGKGKGDRAWQSGERRSEYWGRVESKHGVEVDLIATQLDEELAFLCECEAINLFRRRGARLVNMTEGGEGAVLTDPDAKRRHSEGNSRSWTDERRASHSAKVSAALAGRHFSDAHKAAISAAKSGAKLSEQHRERIGASVRGKKRSPEQVEKQKAAYRRPEVAQRMAARTKRSGVPVVCVETGRTFGSATEAAAWLQSIGVPAKRVGIKDAARGAQKSAYGHQWRYAKVATGAGSETPTLPQSAA